MKILHVVEPFSSGITTFIIHLVNGMNSHENIVLHGARVSSDEMENVRSKFNSGTKFILWKHAIRSINPIKDLLAIIQLISVIRNQKPDVIHLHSSKAGFLGRVVGIFYSVKIIYTPNGLSFARQDVSGFSKRLYIWLELLASKFSGEIICCSKSEKLLLNEYGIASTHINNGTHITGFKYDKSKNDSDIITIGCLALITEQKDPHLFNTIARYFENNQKIRFIWIGDGHLRYLLTSKNIQITGWLNDKEKENYFSQFDIYLSCSLWEGLPFSVLEAMNKRQALILRKCVGNIDLVDQGKNGYLFQAKNECIDFIEKLIGHRSQIERLGNNSYNILRDRFNLGQMVESYYKEYVN